MDANLAHAVRQIDIVDQKVDNLGGAKYIIKPPPPKHGDQP
jgi:hypothetical protein